LGIQFPLFKNPKKPTVLIFPQLSICMDSGLSLFTVSEAALQILREGRQGNQPQA
jgi:hypothetical protein